CKTGPHGYVGPRALFLGNAFENSCMATPAAVGRVRHLSFQGCLQRGRSVDRRAARASIQRKRNPGTLMRRVELEEKNLQTKRKRPAETPALSRFTLRELELAIGALVSVRGEQPRAL